MKNIKVRFNLGLGENYMKWKISYLDGTHTYYNPSDVQLVMKDCILKNSKPTAIKIYQGQNKTVCASVICKSIEIITENFTRENENRLKYNPRVLPFWNLNGQDVDSSHFKEIFSVDSGLYSK